MKKHLILISAALALGLAGCGQPAEEVAPSAETTPAPVPTVMVAATAAPTAAAPVVTAAPAPTEVAVLPTPAPTPVPTQIPAPVPTPEPVPTPAPAPVLLPEETPEPTPGPVGELVVTPDPEEPYRPTEEEVLEAYHKAEEAYSWFDLTTLPVVSDNGVIGPGYYPVADERFPTMDALRAYLKDLFSDEVVDNLLPLDGEHYVEIDGILCAIQMDRGTDEERGDVTLEVIWPQEGEPVLCTVRARVEILDLSTYPFAVIGEEIHEFPYQKVGDKWVFTHFEPIK